MLSSFIRGNGDFAESSLDKEPGSTTEAGVNLKSHNNKKHSDVHDQYGYGGKGKYILWVVKNFTFPIPIPGIAPFLNLRYVENVLKRFTFVK